MSNSNLEVSKGNRANKMSQLNHLTKFRLEREKIFFKKIVNTLLFLIMQANFLLHYLHPLAL